MVEALTCEPAGFDPRSVFAIIVTRDLRALGDKLKSFDDLEIDYVIISGEPSRNPRVRYREPMGKFDALNYGFDLIPQNKSLVILNDSDTIVENIEKGFEWFSDPRVGLVHGSIQVTGGPQVLFYRILYGVMNLIGPVVANGEFMIIRKNVLKKIVPLPPCKAEDSLLAFRVLQAGLKVVRDNRITVITTRTKRASKEEDYKRINVCGLYQALSLSSPPIMIRVFYSVLPLFAPLLLIAGGTGRFWLRGIIEGFVDYLRGDKSGFWQPTYLEGP